MSTPFITPPRPQINLDSSPTPHPKPLADIQNGFADAGGRPLLAGGTRWPDPHPNAFHVMNNALKLAAAIILHPKGLEIASQIMSGSKHPNKLYPTAIRRALSLGTVIILVDHSMEPTVFGRHLHANVDDMEGDIKHRIIFVNPWNIQRLVDAQLAAKDCADDYHRHLFIAAVGLAHELIHLLRAQVYTILLPFGINVPFMTPPRNGSDDEGGWAFEEEMMGGHFEGLWVTDDEPEAFEVTIGTVGGLAIGVADPAPANIRKTSPFDHLAVSNPDGKLYKVPETWISETVNYFEKYGCVDSIVFPPTMDPTPLRRDEVKRLGLHKTRPSCVIYCRPGVPQPHVPQPQST
ncbi:uncharacterized protein EHS24_008200 [Apiotrichum porosum]|uniref:Uncharacterized protein n=1 Tax=Apiotrichum porosum TaxID=105984 RepID=A0A427XT69_9TREE|nr:uncharacterized protein EHS24_008200 [Apiotrichum porosum]RSH81998.1 hypothetical protein EHS24_008200 [Apiotrichum porosum]